MLEDAAYHIQEYMYNYSAGPCSDVAVYQIVVVCLMLTCIPTRYYN